jgi:hypothetical protein
VTEGIPVKMEEADKKEEKSLIYSPPCAKNSPPSGAHARVAELVDALD